MTAEPDSDAVRILRDRQRPLLGQLELSNSPWRYDRSLRIADAPGGGFD